MRYARARDNSQPGIVARLRLVPGCQVDVMSNVGRGVPDLKVTYRGAVVWLECKNPGAKWRRKLTPAQERTKGAFAFVVVTTPEEALKAIGAGA